MEEFDIGIIGGGPAGYTTALYYSKLGKSVVLFEKDELGGTCLNRGCIPTKAFLHVADLYSEIKESENLGLTIENISFDWAKIKEYKDSIITKLRKGLEFSLKGINVIKSFAELTEKQTIISDNTEYKCEKIIIATGSKPREIQGLEFDHKYIISSDDILELKELPESIAILGSGAIGIEWARILSSFGVKVTIIELMDRLCPISDWEVSKRIERQFKMKKIDIHTSTSIDKIENNKLILSNGETIEPEKLLVAVGREITEVNNKIENPDIRVIGDASAEIMLAHYAVSQAKELVLDIPFNKDIVPSVIYGTPEIAWVGKVCKTKEEDNDYDKHYMLLSALGKSHCDNKTDGFIKIISRNNKIIGASIIAPEASALIQQIVIGMTNNLSIDDFKKCCFAHPSYSEGIMEVLI